MKIPSFMKTIRFRLTLWYVAFLMLLIIGLMLGLNVKMGSTVAQASPSPLGSAPPANQTIVGDNTFITHLRSYSIVGAILVMVVGAAGIYFLSGAMLKPIDKVISLARRSSYSNLKERLNYAGPNDEIQRLADTFDNMLERLKGTVDSQKQFIQDASHELRTPIATAVTNIEVLEMNSAATLTDYQELTRVLKLSLDRMNKISNSLQLLSEDAVVQTKWTQVNVTEVIGEVVKEIVMEAKRRGVDLSWKPPDSDTCILGDAFRIKQAIFNLVDNAIKYNRPGGSVNIVLRTENQSAIIQVADTGIGIAKDDLPKIFDRFFRVDKSRSRERGGSGLGLAIVKKIVEEHRGFVSVESVPGQGSTFRVELPLYLQD